VHLARSLPRGAIHLALPSYPSPESDTPYATRFKVATNRNLPLIRDLKKAGVTCSFAGSAYSTWGSKGKAVAAEVAAAASAVLARVNRQTDRYVYISTP
jgi:hypothetical protein